MGLNLMFIYSYLEVKLNNFDLMKVEHLCLLDFLKQLTIIILAKNRIVLQYL